PNLALFDAKVRVDASRVEDVHFSDPGDQLRPQILIHLERMLHRVEHTVFVAELEHEAQHAAIQVEVGEDQARAFGLREGGAQVHRQRGGSDAGFGRHKGENIVGNVVKRLLAFHQVADVAQGLENRVPLEGWSQELADPGTHGLAQNFGIERAVHGDELYARSVRFEEANGFQRFFRHRKAQEHHVGTLGAHGPGQVYRVGVGVEFAEDRYFSDDGEGAFQAGG